MGEFQVSRLTLGSRSMLVFSAVRTGLEETPVPQPTVDPDSVTPGPFGFLVVALLVVVVILLAIDMLRRVRRMKYRAEVQEMLDAEEQAAREAADADEATSTDDDSASAEDDRGEGGNATPS